MESDEKDEVIQNIDDGPKPDEIDTVNIVDVCKTFLKLLRKKNLKLDEIATTMVSASLSYYIQNSLDNMEWRSEFLQKAFKYIDTLNPTHLNLFTKRIWDAFKSDDMNFILKLQTLNHCISTVNETGRAIAICLTWTILSDITKTDIEMHGFHEFNELIKMLNKVHYTTLLMDDNLHIVYMLIQCIAFLINTVVYGVHDDFQRAGYTKYFTYSKRDLEELKKYLENLCSQLYINANAADNNSELRKTINEYIQMNIIDLLCRKIIKM